MSSAILNILVEKCWWFRLILLVSIFVKRMWWKILTHDLSSLGVLGVTQLLELSPQLKKVNDPPPSSFWKKYNWIVFYLLDAFDSCFHRGIGRCSRYRRETIHIYLGKFMWSTTTVLSFNTFLNSFLWERKGFFLTTTDSLPIICTSVFGLIFQQCLNHN